MPFRFALAPLLRVRQAVEDHEQAKLERVLRELAAAKAHFCELQEGLARLQNVLSASLAESVPGSELHFSHARIAGQKSVLTDFATKISKLEAAAAEQMQRYQYARQQREVMDSVRQQQLEQYQRDMVRKAQRENDDLFLIRSAFNSNG